MVKFPGLFPSVQLGISVLALGLVYTVPAAGETASVPRVPRLGTEWVRVCTMPDLGELAGPDPGRQHINDHGFIRDAHGRWQLWAAIRGTRAGHIFYGWEGKSLREAGWEPRGVKLRADALHGERVNPDNRDDIEAVLAPYFLREGDTFYGFYNSAGIRLLVSQDGVNFTRAPDANGSNMLYRHGGRDVMVFKEDGRYFAYSTISVEAGGWGSGFIIVKTSTDLRQWSDFTVVSQGGVAGGGLVSAESPFVVKVDGYYYLFRSSSTTQTTFVYRSETPYHFGVHDDSKLIAELPVFAAEVIEEDGRTYISDIHDFQGIRVTTLDWVEAPPP